MLKETPISASPILLVGDIQGIMAHLYELLRGNFPGLMLVSDAAAHDAVGGCSAGCIIAFCYDRIADAQDRLLGLLRSEAVQTPLNCLEVVAFCRASEQREACDLVLAGVFDDYAVVEPFPHIEHLQVVFGRASERLRLRHELVASRGVAGYFSARVDGCASDLEWPDNAKAMALEDLNRHQAWLRQQIVRLLEGRSATVTDQFPAARNAAARISPLSALDGHFKEFRTDVAQSVSALTEKLVGRHREQLHLLSSAARGAGASAARVMVIDDDEDVAVTAGRFLENAGHIVRCIHTESDIRNALVIVLRFDPDVILLDINLGLLDGVSVLEMIKSDPRSRNVPVLMISGLAYRDVVRRTRASGAAGFVAKPIDSNVLLRKVKEAVGSSLEQNHGGDSKTSQG